MCIAIIAFVDHMDEYKVIIIGALGAGKTSILCRYVHDTFEDRVLSKFVISEEKKSVAVNGKEVVLRLWDTAGQERFQSIMTNRFYVDTHAVIIVYDTNSDQALQDINVWIREIEYYMQKELENGMPVLIVGNKKDLIKHEDIEQQRMTFRQVQQIAESNGFLAPLKCSAKTGAFVAKVFETIAENLVPHTETHREEIVSFRKTALSERTCRSTCGV